MLSVECSTTAGPITINNNEVVCGSAPATEANYLSILGAGKSTPRISISHSDIAIALHNVSTTSAITADCSTVLLLFCGANQLSGVTPAINCANNSNLTFSVALGANLDASGIGSGQNQVCGSLQFMNGTSYIFSDSEEGSAIGSGRGSGGSPSMLRNLTIVDGDLSAVASSGAAIGAAMGASRAEISMRDDDKTAGSLVQAINILGGNISAIAARGAGIGAGAGDRYGGCSRVDLLAVFGGTIEAWVEEGAAAIGSGLGDGDGNSTVGDVLIVDGRITASGSNNGGGIGSGAGRNEGTSTVDTLTIAGGTIAVAADSAAGIGAGTAVNDGMSRVGNLTILNGSMNTSASHAAGIGSGDASTGIESVVESLTIVCGSISAQGSEGAGIGSGRGNSAVFDLTFVGGDIYASSALNGAAIGGGFGQLAPISNLVVLNGSFTLSSGYAGIGQGSFSTVQSLTIHSGFFDCTSLGD
jgi:hypothetical protein